MVTARIDGHAMHGVIVSVHHRLGVGHLMMRFRLLSVVRGVLDVEPENQIVVAARVDASIVIAKCRAENVALQYRNH